MTKETILGFVRHVLTFGGGFAVSDGLITADDLTAIVGAIATLAGVVWSAIAKKKAG